MPEEDEVTLYDYIKVINKKKWLIIIGTFACILTAAIVTLLLPRVYETRATLTMMGPDVRVYESRPILTMMDTGDARVKIGVLNIPTGLSLGGFFNHLPNNPDLHLKVITRLSLDKSPHELTPQALSQMITFSLSRSGNITINVRYNHPEKAKEMANTMVEVVKEHYQALNEGVVS